jgi:serine/threonine-protein kinase
MKLMYVPAGEFQMGSNNSNNDDKPVHTVSLDAFWIDQTDVTNAMYAKCVSAGFCQPPSNISSSTQPSYYDNRQFADYPVIYVNWSQADTYCKWVGRSLPTEAQWEKAARSTDGRTFPWGEEIDESLANYNNNVRDTTRVGDYPSGASPYGALDMAGNVSQWVADWYDSKYYQNSPQNNPTGPSSGQYRVLRGGSWLEIGFSSRSAVRVGSDPMIQSIDHGFRCSVSRP